MESNNKSTFPSQFQEYIYLSRYARWLEEPKRREHFAETIDRYFTFFDDHLLKTCNFKFDEKTKKELIDGMLELEYMPSMRCLMSAGEALKKENVAGYNCSYITIDTPRAFDEAMYVLMCGTGVGFSVESKYIEKLPIIAEEFSDSDTTIVVQDSRAGWTKSVRELVQLLYVGQIPKWDVSKVRPKGARLKTFGGRASGPEPLVSFFKFCIATFKKAAGRRLTSLECHDIICKIGEVVVVGGVRRSAMISLSDINDDRMRHAKSGNWWTDNGQRALANNSYVIKEELDAGTFMREWLALYDSKSGERGIFSREACKLQAEKFERRDSSYEFGTNPCCVTGDTKVWTKQFGIISIKKLTELFVLGQKFEVMGYDAYTGEDTYTEVLGAQLTRPNSELLILTVIGKDGRSYVLKLTPDHKVLIRKTEFETEYISAEKLKVGDSTFVIDMFGVHIGKVSSISNYPNEDTYDIQTTTKNFFANNILVHNSEIVLRPSEFCNLSEAVIRSSDKKEDIKRKLRMATIIGTIQSTLTNFKYINKEWKNNCDEERLLGVSLTGITDNPLTSGEHWKATYGDQWKCNFAEFLEELRNYVIAINKEWAEKLGIPQSAATTCIKPSGTVSQLVNSASGIHPRYSKYYIRTVRANKTDPLAIMMKEIGFPVEDDINSPDDNFVFSFPVESPNGAMLRNSMSAIEQLELWLLYYRHYCEHKPSITVYVREDEWMKVGSWVYEHINEMSGVSFLPHSEHVYQQAPYQEISEEEYMSLTKKMPKNVNWSLLENYEKDNAHITATREYACTSGACELV